MKNSCLTNLKASASLSATHLLVLGYAMWVLFKTYSPARSPIVVSVFNCTDKVYRREEAV